MDHVQLARAGGSPARYDFEEPAAPPELPSSAGPLDRLVFCCSGVLEVIVAQPDGSRVATTLQRGQHMMITDAKPFAVRRALSSGHKILGGDVCNIVRDGLVWHAASAPAPAPDPARPAMTSAEFMGWTRRRNQLRGLLDPLRRQRAEIDREIAALEAELEPVEARLKGAAA